jgi:bacillithiol biosynthesis deacetylase BshB1
MVDSLDVLAFGPHPDDIEIGAGGTLAKHAALGHRVGLCDLTRGELGSNGTPEERVIEAEAAARALGAVWRENLEWPERRIGRDEAHLRAAAEMIRRWRPRIVVVPYWDDRHPDHVASSQVLREAVFNAGLRRFDVKGDAWRPQWICYYFINEAATPSFVVDVSAHYETKRTALACHRSQFAPHTAAGIATRINTPLFMQLIESRDAQFGAQMGVLFAEGFVVRETLVRPNLFKTEPATR